MSRVSKSAKRQIESKYGRAKAQEVVRSIERGHTPRAAPADRRRINKIVRR